MYYWNKIETKTEADFIFNILKEKIGNSKITGIFSFDDSIPENKNNKIEYNSLAEPLYILFDNDYCLIIDFVFYSSLNVEYRKLKTEEINNISQNKIDYFNSHHEVYGWDFDKNGNRIEESFKIKHVIDISGQYDEILKFEINGFHDEYFKWINNGINSSLIKIPAGGDYFSQLKIILNNGIKIIICPQPTESDGYYDLILDGITYNEVNK